MMSALAPLAVPERARTFPKRVRALTSAATLWFAAITLAWGGPESATPGLQTVSFHGQSFLVREDDPKNDDLQMFWKDDNGNPLLDFNGLEKYVASKGQKLLFAANAGMFDPDNKPVGVFVQNEKEVTPLNQADGPGNFHMKPNGVFLINEKHEAMVVDSSSYPVLLTPVVWATQSGPMLVIAGNVHPDFVADSKNLNIRSGVGVRKDGMIEFAISTAPVNFYDFAEFFCIRLKCPNALYLDGAISAFHAPGLKDNKVHFFGPMIGITSK